MPIKTLVISLAVCEAVKHIKKQYMWSGAEKKVKRTEEILNGVLKVIPVDKLSLADRLFSGSHFEAIYCEKETITSSSHTMTQSCPHHSCILHLLSYDIKYSTLRSRGILETQKKTLRKE